MKPAGIFVIMLMLITPPLRAQDPIRTPADAFNAGKDFAKEGKAVAGGTVNRTTGSAELPHYSTSAPETKHFQGGRNPIGEAGVSKQTECATRHSLKGFEQQECDAVNFLVKNPTKRPKYTMDKKTDPLLTGSKETIEKPGPIPGDTNQQCRVETITTPGTFITETCTETYGLDNVTCDKVLVIKQNPGCTPGQFLGRILKNICPYCTDPYIVGDVYCAWPEQGYTMSVWTSTTSDGNTRYNQIFDRSPIPGKVGLSQDNTFIGNFGRRCNWPFYYSQKCDEKNCDMKLSLIGSTCNGSDFAAPGNYKIPFTYTDSWDDQCVSLDGRTR